MTYQSLTQKFRISAASMMGASLLAVASVALSGVTFQGAAIAQDAPADEGRQFDAKSGEAVKNARADCYLKRLAISES